jgi:hypothetical protein
LKVANKASPRIYPVKLQTALKYQHNYTFIRHLLEKGHWAMIGQWGLGKNRCNISCKLCHEENCRAERANFASEGAGCEIQCLDEEALKERKNG